MPSGNFSEEGCVNPKHKISANEIGKRMKSIIKGNIWEMFSLKQCFALLSLEVKNLIAIKN